MRLQDDEDSIDKDRFDEDFDDDLIGELDDLEDLEDDRRRLAGDLSSFELFKWPTARQSDG